jgi:hypothetical protein
MSIENKLAMQPTQPVSSDHGSNAAGHFDALESDDSVAKLGLKTIHPQVAMQLLAIVFVS